MTSVQESEKPQRYLVANSYGVFIHFIPLPI